MYHKHFGAEFTVRITSVQTLPKFLSKIGINVNKLYILVTSLLLSSLRAIAIYQTCVGITEILYQTRLFETRNEALYIVMHVI